MLYMTYKSTYSPRYGNPYLCVPSHTMYVRKLTRRAYSTRLRELISTSNISCKGCEPHNEIPSMQEVFVRMPKINSSSSKRETRCISQVRFNLNNILEMAYCCTR